MPVRVTVEAEGAVGGAQRLKLHLPAGLSRGALYLEVGCGGFLSPPQVMPAAACVVQSTVAATL